MSDTLGSIIERAALKARVAELQARNTKLVKILADIHELLHPPLIEHDGKTFKFVNPDANAVLEELSSRIRAIPDSIGALPNEQGGHIARLEKDAERYRWLAGHCRSTSEHWGGRWSIIIDGPAPKNPR